MIPKPEHLGPTYAAQFGDAAVASAYRHRPHYPAAAFDLLLELLGDRPRDVLDLGCGSGDLAIPLAARVRRLDAVDPSAAMLAAGRARPGGEAPNLRWIHASAEDAPLRPPYGLVTAAESLHWMDWYVVLPRLAGVLAPGGVLAIVERGEAPHPWDAALQALIRAHSTNREFRPYSLVEELEARGLFRRHGTRATPAVPVAQPVAAYVESFHSRNGLSRDRMPAESARAFDEGVAALVAPYAPDGLVHLEVFATVWWGAPLAGDTGRPDTNRADS